MTHCIRIFKNPSALVLSCILFMVTGLNSPATAAATINDFIGNYVGSVELSGNGATEIRDMSVQIQETKKGFSISWTSVIQRADGRTKESEYTIKFLPTRRENIFSSAMKNDVFGHAVPLNPMKGEPYVWARINDDTLTVFSLHVDEEGSYEMQQYDRTLIKEGLKLNYQRVRNGNPFKSVEAVLTRVE